MNAATARETWNVDAPTLPWIAGYVLDSDDMSATARHVNGRTHGQRIAVTLPPALGGMLIFQAAGSAPWA